MTLAIVNTVWIGPRLGPLHAACLRSFVRNGHKTILHSYEIPPDLPQGVEIHDANILIEKSKIVRYKSSGSFAIFSDYLRYEIQKRGLGLYVDCDCYCMREIEDEEYLFGFETNNSIANAVLKLPADSLIVEQLCSLKNKTGFVPPWLGPRRQAYYKLRSGVGMTVPLHHMPWGTSGPMALTWYANAHNLVKFAKQIDYYYPVHFNNTSLLFDADLSLRDLASHRTQIIHLSNDVLSRNPQAIIPDSSPLGEILRSK